MVSRWTHARQSSTRSKSRVAGDPLPHGPLPEGGKGAAFRPSGHETVYGFGSGSLEEPGSLGAISSKPGKSSNRSGLVGLLGTGRGGGGMTGSLGPAGSSIPGGTAGTGGPSAGAVLSAGGAGVRGVESRGRSLGGRGDVAGLGFMRGRSVEEGAGRGGAGSSAERGRSRSPPTGPPERNPP
jgi:hypothetical protein